MLRLKIVEKEDRTEGSGWDFSTVGQLTCSPTGKVTESCATFIYRAGTGCWWVWENHVDAGFSGPVKGRLKR